MASTTIGDKTITAYLRKIIGSPVGQIIPLTNSSITIGRSKKSHICIDNANICLSHCTLIYSTNGWFLTDLGGANGTFIDNYKLISLLPYLLKDGNSIYLGPPSDSPDAFVFIKNKVEGTPKEEEEQLPIQKESPNDDYQNQSQSTQPNLKRRANTNNHSSPSKKHAPSTSRHQPVSSESTSDLEDSDNSMHNLDSLRTRLRKMRSAERKKDPSNSRLKGQSALLRRSYDRIPSTTSTLASTSKKEPQVNLGDLLEEGFICDICTEVFINATALGCSHTFCEHCIAEWKKEQQRCPMCRAIITSETRISFMDSFIDNAVGKFDKVYQDKRKKIIDSREAAKVNEVEKTRIPSNTPIGLRRINHEDPRQFRLNLLNEVPVNVGESVELLDMSAGSSSYELVFEYCLFCGDRYHDTNDCPALL